MELAFLHEYNSIKHLPIDNLPDFVVITGVNGSGKTHFLKAIDNGAIQVKDIEPSTIKYYNWSDMAVADEQPVVASQLGSIQKDTIEHILDLRDGYETHLHYLLSQYAKSSSLNLTKQRLIDIFTDDSMVASDVNEDSVIKRYLNQNEVDLNQHIEKVLLYPANSLITLSSIQGLDIGRELNAQRAAVLKYILEKSKKPFFALTQEDCFNNYPLAIDVQDPFIGSLAKLFSSYVSARYSNAANSALSTSFNTQAHYLDYNDFIKHYGQPPWEVFNQVLESAGILFRFIEPNPNPDISSQLRLRHTVSGAEVSFLNLSSGERVLISIAHFLFYAQDSRQPTAMPSLILLDEVDAPLHPSMAVDFLNVIKNIMIREYNLKVILATHSPSTVALAPEEAVHVMDIETRFIRKVSRDEGIQALTAGIPILSIKIENRRLVLVESDYDADYYEQIVAMLKNYLRLQISFVFISSGTKGAGSCDRVKALVKEFKDAGSHTVFGIIDWDLHSNGNEKVRVLGKGKRYSIENYLFDPIAVAILLFQMRIIGREVLVLDEEQTYADLRQFSNEQLQLVVDNILTFLGFQPSVDKEVRVCSYVNGHAVQIPVPYLEMRGHDLEARIKSKSEKFQKFRNDSALKIEILRNVFYHVPGFLSVDFVELLSGIQDS